MIDLVVFHLVVIDQVVFPLVVMEQVVFRLVVFLQVASSHYLQGLLWEILWIEIQTVLKVRRMMFPSVLKKGD